MEYNTFEINEIKRRIEKYKNFYLPSNKKPFIHLIITLIGIFVGIILLKNSTGFKSFGN